MTSPEQADVEAMKAEVKRLADELADVAFATATDCKACDEFDPKQAVLYTAIDRLAAVALHPQPPDVHLACPQEHAAAAREADERSLPHGWISVEERF
jgi:hypothetical protein